MPDTLQPSPLYWMWQTATAVTSPGRRDEVLTKVVTAALQHHEYRLAVRAAADMSSPGDRNGQLQRVATAAAASEDIEGAAIAVKLISSPGTRSSAASDVIRVLEDRMAPLKPRPEVDSQGAATPGE